MDQAHPSSATAEELVAAVVRRQISPVEIVTDLFARIAEQEPVLNAFAALDHQGALEAARQAETAVMRGETLGPLHGVPVTVKDTVATRRMQTRFGSHLRDGFRPGYDAPSVARLEAAGAIVVGKTTTSEFGWIAKGRSPLTGITRNPWNPRCDAGGSSAGAAAAAAAGLGPLHLATDGAGSIRVPAHFCGVVGFKPTYGLVPQYPLSTNDYTSHPGPIARTVRDAALMLDVMAGPHPLDHTSVGSPLPLVGNGPADLRGKRVAYSIDLGHARVDAAVARVVDDAVGVIARCAAVEITEIVPSWGPSGADIVRRFWPAHLGRFAAEGEHRCRMDPGLLACAEEGLGFTLDDYQTLRERKYAYCSEIGRFFDQWDYLLTPAASVAAFAPERVQPEGWPEHPWDWLGWAETSYPFNFSGSPAASIPCGFTPDGLPVGLQIVGRRFDDAGVLAVGVAIEAVLGPQTQAPLSSKGPEVEPPGP